MPKREYTVSVRVMNDEDRSLAVVLSAPDDVIEEGSLVSYMGIWHIDADVEWGNAPATTQQILRVRVRAKLLDEVFYDHEFTVLHYNRDPESPQTWRLDLHLKSQVRFVPKGGYREDGFSVELVTLRD